MFPQRKHRQTESAFNGADQAIDWVTDMINATRQAIDVKEANSLNANDEKFMMAA